MFENIHLNEKELLYVSMLNNVDNIWGTSDPFKDMDEDSIRMDVLRMQMSLLQKGYAVSEEDDQFAIIPELSDLIYQCAQSKLIFIFSTDEMENSNHVLRYFASDNEIIRFVFKDEASFVKVSKDQMYHELVDGFGERDVAAPKDCLITSSSRLKRLGSLSRNRFIQELKDLGCEDELSTVIADGLQGNSSFRILLCFKMGDSVQGTPIDKVVSIHSPGGNLIAKSFCGSNPDTVCFMRMDRTQLQKDLQRIIDWIDEGA